MATTVTHQPPGGQYIKVVNGTTNDFLLQNIGATNSPVMIRWGTTQPASTANGHILHRGEAVVRNGLTGNVYAIGLTGDTVVAVTEE